MKDYLVVVQVDGGKLRQILLCNAPTKDEAKERAKIYGKLVGIIPNPKGTNLIGINGKRVG